MTRSIPGFCLSVLLLLAASGAFAQEDRVAAVVNDEPITQADLDARTTLVLRSAGLSDDAAAHKRLAHQVLERLVDERLEMQEAKRLGVAAAQDEIGAALRDIERRSGAPEGGLDALLAQEGVSKASLVGQVTAAVTWAKVVKTHVAPGVALSEADVDAALAAADAKARRPHDHVFDIVLPVRASSEDAAEKRFAYGLIRRIQHGERFNLTARQFSDAPSAAAGGDLGWLTLGDLPATLAGALAKMNPGEMSYPIRAADGYHILYLVARRENGVALPTRTEVADALLRQRIKAAAERRLDALRHDGYIDIREAAGTDAAPAALDPAAAGNDPYPRERMMPATPPLQQPLDRPASRSRR